MKEPIDVLYNASCPICSREVAQYAKYTAQAALPVRYGDATDPAELCHWGITADEAARRFHVRKDGQIYAGVAAFVILWEEIPQTRWLARLVGLPGINWLASLGYDHIAAPLLYRLHLRRQRDT